MPACFLRFDTTFTISHDDENVFLANASSKFNLRLFGGDDVFETEFKMGVNKTDGSPIVAHLTVPYNYDCLSNNLVLWGDREFPERSPSLHVQNVLGNNVTVDYGDDKISDVLKNTLKEILNAATEQGIDCDIHYEVPEQFKDALIVCEPGKRLRFFNPDYDDPSLPMKPLTSTSSAHRKFKAGTYILNAKDTTHDPKPPLPDDPQRFPNSWMELWQAYGVKYGFGWDKRPYSQVAGGRNFCCCQGVNHTCTSRGRTWLVGAHVVKGRLSEGTKQQWPIGSIVSPDVVHIIPACNKLNNSHDAEFYLPRSPIPPMQPTDNPIAWDVVLLKGFVPTR
ncbi:hypothetical protein FACS1894188_04570 [Clostridia bacterium]|nr:hypothetical protein FACS1894188_04570 [Clostridia bacterium]